MGLPEREDGYEDTMMNAMSRPMGRFFYWPILIALIALCAAQSGMAATPTKTIVQDTIYRADGNIGQGTLLIAWGQSQLSRAANNYFGIKAHGKHPAMDFRTSEFKSSGEVRITAKFAVYRSMEESFECRDRQIANGEVYASARRVKTDPESFAREMGKHWATDPKYAEKLLTIYRENGFDKLDAN
jgi:hypothetical protein